MQQSRRNFIQLTGTAAAGFTLAGLPVHSFFNDDPDAGRIRTFGIQLYTLRDVLPKDPKNVLRQLASFGYRQIESYEGKEGMFWGMSAADFKRYMDDLGMKIVSSHCDINKDFERKAADAASIGMKHLICAWVGPQKTTDDFKKIADTFNQRGEICRKNGIRFAYHNHEYSFNTLEGQLPQDIMMNNTDPALVDFEMDIYWVVTAKQDPEAWLKKYKKRFRYCHVKDRISNSTERNASCILGQGSIDFAGILKTAKKNGMEYFIVEQERYDNSTSMKSAEADAVYMKGLKI
jgi:sugar phosphate isomerase/epimerase